ncbi:MAG: hypothetical protein WEA08_04825, partial [Woeseia sp.]
VGVCAVVARLPAAAVAISGRLAESRAVRGRHVAALLAMTWVSALLAMTWVLQGPTLSSYAARCTG